MEDYVWSGGTDPCLDGPRVGSVGRVTVGLCGGNAAHGARKNEDAALVWSGEDWVSPSSSMRMRVRKAPMEPARKAVGRGRRSRKAWAKRRPFSSVTGSSAGSRGRRRRGWTCYSIIICGARGRIMRVQRSGVANWHPLGAERLGSILTS